MKKLIIIFPVLFVVTLVFANTFFFSSPTLVNKEINLSIYSNDDYNTAAYDSSLAQVAVSVKRLSGNETHVAFTRIYDAKQLKQYAPEKNAASEKLNIQDVKDDRETLVVTYTITYNTKGSKIIFEKNEVIGKGTNNKKIEVII